VILIAMNAGFLWQEWAVVPSDLWVLSLPVSIPGYAVHAKNPHANMKLAQKSN
jgi:hypothetical protein